MVLVCTIQTWHFSNRTCPNLSGFIQNCPNLSKLIQTCPILFKFVYYFAQEHVMFSTRNYLIRIEQSIEFIIAHYTLALTSKVLMKLRFYIFHLKTLIFFSSKWLMFIYRKRSRSRIAWIPPYQRLRESLQSSSFVGLSWLRPKNTMGLKFLWISIFMSSNYKDVFTL